MGEKLRLRAADASAMRAMGRRLADVLRPGDVVRLEGPLGAGKTTMVQGIAAGLGVAAAVTSPSFALIHEHEARRDGRELRLVHADFYRLNGADDAALIGLEEYLDGRAILAVEWASRAPDTLAADGVEVGIEPDGDERTVTIHALGPRGLEIVRRLAGVATG